MMSDQKPRATSTPPTHDSTDTRPAPDSFPAANDDAPLVTAPTVKTLTLDPIPDPVPPKDIEGVRTIVSEPPRNAAPRVRVYEDAHTAEAVIITNNEDSTLDLSTDLWGNGNPITLYGVGRREGGTGNGWELVDEKTPQPVVVKTTERAPNHLTTLRAETVFDGVLEIFHSRYPVTGGVVTVPPWHADAARAAGYHEID